MKHFLTLALLVLVVSPAGAAEITQYSTRIDVGADGTGKAVTTLALSGAPGEVLQIPVVPGWANLKLGEAPEGLTLDPPKEKAAVAKVTLPAATAAAARFTLLFDVAEAFAKPEDPAAGAKLTLPRESRTLKTAFVNTQPALIKTFELLVVLPEGYRFQAIREQLPKLKKSEVEPRVRLGGADGRQTARLQIANLKQGDSASMQLEAVPNRRSPFWLVAGIVLAALYLFKFRDLVAKSAGVSSSR